MAVAYVLYAGAICEKGLLELSYLIFSECPSQTVGECRNYALNSYKPT